MPAILLALGSLLIQVVGTMAGRVLVSLGIGVVTYTGVNATLTWLKAQAVAQFALLSGDALQVLGVLRVGPAISVIFSAIVARFVLNGVTSDSFKRFVLK